MVGTIPEAIVGLELQALNLMNNKLTGTIPDALIRIQRRHDNLDFSNNPISGTLPQTNLTSKTLVKLNISSTKVSGTIPDEMWRMTELTILDARSSAISGTIASMTTERRARPAALNCSGYGTTWGPDIGSPPVGCEHLIFLGASDTNISGTIPRTLISSKVLDLARTPISGTIPHTLLSEDLEGLFLAQARLSGSIPSNWEASNKLKYLSAQQNALSGYIPSTLGTLTVLEVVSLFGNELSGSLPSELGSLTSLSLLSLQNNKLTGTGSSAFNSWKKLKLLSLYGNRELSWDLSILEHLTGLVAALLQDCNIKGKIPASFSFNSNFEALILHNNALLAGTIPEALGTSHPNLTALTLYNSKLSGTLPNSLWQLPELETLLAHGMQLSGTLPQRKASRRKNDTWALSTLSLARNYIRGRTDGLNDATELQTLLLSGNYLSGNAVQLNEANDLGNASILFFEPSQVTLNDVAAKNPIVYSIFASAMTDATKANELTDGDIEGSFPPFEYAEPETFKAIALAFTGNSLTSSGSNLPSRDPGHLCKQDRIRQGFHGYFAGHNLTLELIFFILPILFLFFLAAFLPYLLWPNCAGTPTWFGSSCMSRALSYCRPPPPKSRIFHWHLYASLRPSMLLAILGIGLTALYLWIGPSLAGDRSDADPLIQVTIAPIDARSEEYQYIFVVIAFLVNTVSVVLLERLAGLRREERGRAITQVLQHVCKKASPEFRVISDWRDSAIGETRGIKCWRCLCYYLGLLLTILVSTAPTCGYVLLTNVSSTLVPSAFSIFANPFVIAATQKCVQFLLVDPLAYALARLKHGGKVPITSLECQSFYKSQANVKMMVDVAAIIVIPMAAVIVLDESCLRNYLYFDYDLRSLLETWGLGMTGFEAYRLGFCSRQLLAKFIYAWLQLALCDVIFMAGAWLLSALPCCIAVFSKSQACLLASTFGQCLRLFITILPIPDRVQASLIYEDDDDRAFAETVSIQSEAVALMSMFLTAAVLGPAVPLLLLLLPLAVWMQLCAQYNYYRNKCSFTDKLAADVLAHVPIRTAQVATVCVGCIWNGYLVWDLEFGLRPMALFGALFVFEVFLMWLLRPRANDDLMCYNISTCLRQLVLLNVSNGTEDLASSPDVEFGRNPLQGEHVEFGGNPLQGKHDKQDLAICNVGIEMKGDPQALESVHTGGGEVDEAADPAILGLTIQMKEDAADLDDERRSVGLEMELAHIGPPIMGGEELDLDNELHVDVSTHDSKLEADTEIGIHAAQQSPPTMGGGLGNLDL